MKLFIKLFVLGGTGMLLAACTVGNGIICGPQTPRAYCDKEAYEKLANPKAYGEYWVKPGMTKESWQQDWVACGGFSSGQYGAYVPPGSNDAISSALWEQKRKQLDACMRAKGYEYHYTGS